MLKVRTSITLDKGLLSQAKQVADQKDVTLSDVVQDALKAYIPPVTGIERTEQGTVYVSGPTISTMQPNQTGLGVPTHEEVRNAKSNNNDALGAVVVK